eukprot:978777-Pleurochrysis_carterae.AAC.2
MQKEQSSGVSLALPMQRRKEPDAAEGSVCKALKARPVPAPHLQQWRTNADAAGASLPLLRQPR